ncbi:deoxyribose-phosphate aldolase [Tenacibaculum geojense]|uniref:Deoxyribose-phosphate aldolase n=1 Tax=Tenacibaculum geojense TaxID=915352 RepID=A0ABW3JV87_9FLAO
MKIHKYIDHTNLKPTATKQDIINLCEEAKKHHFFAVCINPCYIELAKENLKNTTIKVATVIGFPLGASTTETKIFEAKNAIKNGADEIDMVLNIGALKAGDYSYVEKEISLIKQAIGHHTLKVILENCYLSSDEITTACKLCLNAKADFVKTSTGFGTNGATFKDVTIMNSVVDGESQIKAAGGIRDLETALKFIEMGVTRLGTSSGVALVTQGFTNQNDY